MAQPEEGSSPELPDPREDSTTPETTPAYLYKSLTTQLWSPPQNSTKNTMPEASCGPLELQDSKVALPADTKNPPIRLCNGKPATFYAYVRCLGVISTVLGTFPLSNTTQRDGKLLKHKWFSLINLFDLICAPAFLYWYMTTCSYLVDNITAENKVMYRIWISLMCYIVLFRGTVQFIVVHLYAGRLPPLFAALEEYYQGIGGAIITCRANAMGTIKSVVYTLCLLTFVQVSSFLFFRQINENMTITQVWPVAMSFMMANIWKELPMNMFVKICIQVKMRLREVSAELRALRERGGKELASELELLRLRHASLGRVVTRLSQAYGMQLALNIMFMVLDTVIQLFVFFTVTCSTNFILLVLALYYIVVCFITLVIVEKMQRTDEELLEELAAFEVNDMPRDHQLQIQLFCAQVTAQPIRVSAAGFFNVNNAMMCSVLGGVATYLVMTVQFAPYLATLVSNITIPTVGAAAGRGVVFGPEFWVE